MRLHAAALSVVTLSALLAAGCSGAGSSGESAARPPSSTAATVTASATPARIVHGNIVIAAPGSLAPGPFKITPVLCGKLSAVQKQQFSTHADSGLIFKYQNVSNGITGEPSLKVNFTRGSTVVGDNDSAGFPQVGPGQSAMGEVDAMDAWPTFTGCEILNYALITPDGVGAVYAG